MKDMNSNLQEDEHKGDYEEIQEYFKSKEKLFLLNNAVNIKKNSEIRQILEVNTAYKDKLELMIPNLFNYEEHKHNSNMTALDVLKIRRQLNISQQKLADLIGVDRRTVINYEHGSKIPESKIKLLEMILVQKNSNSEQKTKFQNNADNDHILIKEIDYMKEHIITLKELISEKNKLSELYKSENQLLKDVISLQKIKNT
jgi:DNA-binding transcriptional regulator YiaG